MLDLPPRHGGLGISQSIKDGQAEYKSTLQVTAPLITKITKQDEEIGDILEDLSRQKKKAKQTRQNLHKVTASQLKTELSIGQQRSLNWHQKGEHRTGCPHYPSCLHCTRYHFVMPSVSVMDVNHTTYQHTVQLEELHHRTWHFLAPRVDTPQ